MGEINLYEEEFKGLQANINGAIKQVTKAQANINNNIVNLIKAQTNINGVIKTIWSHGETLPIILPPVTNGLYANFDASYTPSINIESGKVVRWNDKSGNGNHATPPQPQYAPTYENGMIRFNDAHALEFNQLDLQKGSTLFFVANVASGKPNSHQIIANNLGVNVQLRIEATGGQFRLVGSPSIGGSGSDFGYDVLNQAGARFTPTTGQTFNYTSFGGIGTSASTTILVNQIGARVLTGSELLIGSIAEIIIYNRALTDNEIVQVNDYLHYKWIEPIIWDGNYRNLAPEGIATSSTNNKETERAELAIDGNNTGSLSRWISAVSDPSPQLEINLGKKCKIDKIGFYSGLTDSTASVGNYKFQYLKGGIWVDLIISDETGVYEKIHTFDEVIADKILLTFPVKHPSGYQRVLEVEIYGEAEVQ